MKGLRQNLKRVMIIMMTAFALLAAYFIYAVNTYGGRWFTNPYNQRLQSQRSDVSEGAIYDRNGIALAYTEGGKRRYNADKKLRTAVSHTVGDDQGMTGFGAENFMAKYLLGFDQNVFARLQQQFSGKERSGSDVTLTLDAKLCAYIWDALGDYQGAAVVMNYHTGELLASVSKPGFDPENVRDYASDSGSSALVNRATMGRYTPGSVFKLVTAAAALRYVNGAQERTWDCDGPIVFDAATGKYLEYEHIDPSKDKRDREAELEAQSAPSAAEKSDEGDLEAGGVDTSGSDGEHILLRDYNSDYHGEISLGRAVAVSCNHTFGQLAMEVGPQNMASMAKAFGIGDDFMFEDLVLYNSSYEPGATDYTLAWSGVGQYKDIVTPLQMALISASIANDGAMMEPRLLYAVKAPGLNSVFKLKTSVYSRPITGAESDVLTSYMRKCVTEGTGKSAALKNYAVCGKTGTAEVSSDKNVGNHAWFTGFIDDDRHPLAIAVVLEHAGSGGGKAAPVAGKIFAKAIELGY